MSSMHSRRLLPVTVQATRLLIDASQVVGVEDGERVQRNPGAGPPYGWLLGSTDGATVFDLATLLDLGASRRNSASGSVVVLSRSDGELWGLLVDQTGSSLQVPEDEILPLEQAAGLAPYSAVVQIPDDPTLILAPERLHPEDAEIATRKTQPATPCLAASTVRDESQESSPQMLWVTVDPEQRIYAGFSSKQIVEIRDLAPIAPIPGSGLSVTGIAVYDGQALPVANLRELLEATEAPPRSAGRLMIARGTRSGRLVGLPIFGEVRLVELPVSHRPGKIPPEKSAWIRGSYLVDEGTLVVPDLDSLMY